MERDEPKTDSLSTIHINTLNESKKGGWWLDI